MTLTTPDALEQCLLKYASTESSSRDEVSHVIQARYGDALVTPAAEALFQDTTSTTVTQWGEALLTRITTRLTEAAAQGPEQAKEEAVSIFTIGLAAFNSFLQVAWTGPPLSLDPASLLPSALTSAPEPTWNTQIISELSIDGEDVYRLTPGLLYLYISRIILGQAADTLAPYVSSVYWWRARIFFSHQRTLSNRSGTLHDSMLSDITTMEDTIGEEHKDLRARLVLERGLIFHWYGADQKALADYQAAQAITGLVFQVTGALGKRTRFQENDYSQLVILATSANLETPVEEVPEAAAVTEAASTTPEAESEDPFPDTASTLIPPRNPETLPLNDDTVLEAIAFTDRNEAAESNLSTIDQCLLLAHCLNVKNTNPAHGLTTEQMMPYVVRVLGHPNNWSIHTTALLLRSRLEANKSRTVERGVLQLQALVDQIPLDDASVAGASERLSWFHGLALPAKWELERELAERFMSIGVVRSAMDIFERLELWEDVISCHQMLGQEEKAEALVHERLAADPNSPLLLCLLGDLKKDPEFWKSSWKVSGHRFARAQRSLGAYYYKEEQWTEAIRSYELALALNPLFDHTWFMLGCTAMHAEDWERSAHAFQRVVAMDDNAEAWNNLGSIYLRLNQKREAFNAFQQALKEKYDSWKIWQNYLWVAVDVGDVAEGIRAIRRLIELRVEKDGEAAVDVEVLRILTRVIMRMADEETTIAAGANVTALKEAQGRRERLSRHMEDLLVNDVTAKITTSPEIWKVCADFWYWREDWAHCLEAYLKAYRATLHRSPVDTDAKAFERAAQAALEAVEAYENFGPREVKGNGQLVAPDWNYQSRSILRSLIGRTRSVFEGTEWHEKLIEKMNELRENLRA